MGLAPSEKATGMSIVRRITSVVTGILALSLPVSVSASDHFAWGADIGTTIDVSGHDMSTLNLDAFFGYKNSVIDILGAGAGINMMVGNSCRAFPLYAIVRTSFRSAPSLCFMDLRGGCVIDNLSDGTTQTGFYMSPAVGFNLAVSKKFKSYITVGYTYNGMKSYGGEYGVNEIRHGVHMVTARFGVTF